MIGSTRSLVLLLTFFGPFTEDAHGAHDWGETLTLEGVSADGRYALVAVEDVQKQYVDWRLHDLESPQKPTLRRFEDAASAKIYVRDLKKRLRLRKPPRAQSTHKRQHVEGRFYEWIDAEFRRFRAFALVGPIGQQLRGSGSLGCYLDPPTDCDSKPQAPWVSAQTHWFKDGVFLVATTWTVRSESGDGSRAIFVHGRIPKQPTRPPLPPKRERESKP